MIPRVYLGLGAAVCFAAALGIAGRELYKLGWEARDAQALREEALVQKASQAAQEAAAEAISGIRVKHVTIRQELEKEVRENVVYRECVASDRVLELTNQALSGGTLPPGRGELPPADSAKLPDL